MSAALQIPEGFESTAPTNGLVFQNASKWAKAGTEGAMVTGIFEGLTEPDTYGKQNFKFTATHPGASIDEDGNEVAYNKGATVIINTTTNLVNKMKDKIVGNEYCVVYDGQNKISKGPYKGKMAHVFVVMPPKKSVTKIKD